VKHIGIGVGMNMIERIEQVRELADFFGFMLGRRPHHAFGDDIDVIALYPKGDRLPTYSRDACLFVGNLLDVENFLEGIRWSRNYDQMIGATTDQRRKQFEDKEVARLEKIKYNKERAETFKTLKKEYT
jgi:hypothetical protein